MFTAIHPETGARVPIEPDYIVTSCPGCGVEHAVDLAELAQELEGFDLYGTNVYCPQCTKGIRENRVVQFPVK